MQENSDMYEFKMYLFDNSEPNGFLFFVQNFNKALNASVMLAANVKIYYLHNLLCRQAPNQFYTLCVQLGSTTMAHLNQVILGLGMYFTSVNALSKQKRVMRHGMRKTHELKLRCYVSHMIKPG